MALIVDLFDPDSGPYSYLDALEHDAAGFESYRKKLWGSQALVSRGAHFLPQLRDGDLHVFPDDLTAFEAECRMVADAVSDIVPELRLDPSRIAGIERYINNFLHAVQLARSRGAGVCIT